GPGSHVIGGGLVVDGRGDGVAGLLAIGVAAGNYEVAHGGIEGDRARRGGRIAPGDISRVVGADVLVELPVQEVVVSKTRAGRSAEADEAVAAQGGAQVDRRGQQGRVRLNGSRT